MKKEKLRKIVKTTQIEYIIELANQHPRWSVNRIFDEALRPRIRNCLIIPLTPNLKASLEKASKTYQISILDVTYHALKEWLKSRNY